MDSMGHPMTRQIVFHGWLSLSMLASVVAIGFSAIVTHSPAFAAGYALVVVAGTVVVLVAFCAKCPCWDAACRHIIFGPLASLLTRRTEGKHSLSDILFTTVALVAIVVYPQMWLVRSTGLSIAFWLLSVILLIEIRRNVCRRCDNRHCHFCR